MSDSTHTPGPWRIGDAGQTIFGPKTDQPAPITIATLQGATPRCGIAERTANKYLIAAAPDLLASLEWVLSMVETDPDTEWHRTMYRAHLDLAREAIAKAKGTV
jgi:hypothetical protein